MPKHYCDYCDVFLTHDSTSVRKAHNSGRNHLSNVRDYYASLGHDKAQSIIDQITSAYESSGGPPPGGFGFGPQHLGGPPPGYGAPMGFGGPMPPPGFAGPRPPFPPNGFPPMMGAPPFPPNGMPMGPPGGFPGGAPPFPPNGPPGAGLPPFPPNGGGPPPGNFNGPPPSNSGPPGPPPAPGSGPSIHPDRLRMMGGGR
ncbi:U1 zinc finger-domain-containing protein [Mycena epipterygia]|nr:U1 zinc finger-domain-containing protein [Mycena epipterygia]